MPLSQWNFLFGSGGYGGVAGGGGGGARRHGGVYIFTKLIFFPGFPGDDSI